MDIIVIIGTLGALIAILQFLGITDVFKVWRWLSNLFSPPPCPPVNVVENGSPPPVVPPPPVPKTGLQKDILDYSNLIADKTRGFVGRRFVFAAIDQFMANHPSGYFIVRGEPGIGKTALAAQLVKTRNCVHHFNIRAEGINKASAFLANVCAQLILKYQLDYATLPPDATQSGGFLGKKLLAEVAAKRAANEKVLIMVDGLDEVDEVLPGVNRLYLPTQLPVGVYLVVTTRPGNPLRIDCDLEELELRQDSADNLTDIRAYLEEATTRAGIQAYLAKHQVASVEFVTHLMEKSQGNFIYLRYVLPEIEEGAYQDWELEAIPAGLQNYYTDHWKRMRGRDEAVWFEYKLPVVVALTLVEEPISVDLIAEFAKVSNKPRIRGVLQEWREFLYETQVPYQGGQQKRYRVYHDSFRNFLAALEEIKEERVSIKDAQAQITNALVGDLFDHA